MYGTYANIWGILMVNVTNIAYMDPMGNGTKQHVLTLVWLVN